MSILDRSDNEVYSARHPVRVFTDFQSIPPVVLASLLYIENRELLDLSNPTRNPAVEWDRLAAAGLNTLVSTVVPTAQRFGGSTLATQIEKFRHSPDGRTNSPAEKQRQVVSASVRAYQGGPDTTLARRRIVVDYLNSTPLSGRSGFGEVIGLGDGLHVWYGTDLDEAVEWLGEHPDRIAGSARSTKIYKQVLSLLLAQRRPSHYLREGRDQLGDLTDTYLRLLADAGIIDRQLRDKALEQSLVFRKEAPASAEVSFVEHKALNAILGHLLSLFQVRSLYDLDRLDMRVEATLDTVAQRNLVRVQADNLDRPLDLNEGGKFDLGSTAKLRTLITYLEIVAQLHNRFASVSAPELRERVDESRDRLTDWAMRYLADANDRSLPAMLQAAMVRRYSGSPATFFTGRGRHSFANSGKRQSGYMSVRQGFRHSVNLVVIRFTSALPTQILKVLEPVLEPVLHGAPSEPIFGSGPMLAENALGERVGQAGATDRISEVPVNHNFRGKMVRHADVSGRSIKHRAPRVIDKLF